MATAATSIYALPLPFSASTSSFVPSQNSTRRVLRPSEPTSTTPSTPSFPLFARITSLSFSSNSTTSKKDRERRISFGGIVGIDATSKGKSKLESSTSATPDLRRSKSARTSLLAAATRRLSTSKSGTSSDPRSRRTSTRDISRPVLQEQPMEEDSKAFMRDYQARAPLFAMSSPELGGISSEEEEPGRNGQWAKWPRAEAGEGSGQDKKEMREKVAPTSPMVKWRKDEGGSSTFLPLTPKSPQSFDTIDAPSSSFSASDCSTAATSVSHSHCAEFLSPPPPRIETLPLPIDRSSSPPIDEATRRANREQALAKLTTPTPTKTHFLETEFDAFPFPRVPTPQLEVDSTSAPPPRPTRKLPPLPVSSGSHSHIVSPTTPLSPPPLPRSNSVNLHPSPSVALDIDFKGRLLRARSTHSTSPPPALSASTSSSSSTQLGSSVGGFSPPSSRFSDWNSRRSSDTSLSLSINPPTPEKGPTFITSPTDFYGISDRRHAESAVDVLAIVEEDESPLRIPSRLGGRVPSVKRSTGAKSSVSPVRRSSSRRISLDSTLASPPRGSQQDVLIIPRTRSRPPNSSNIARPHLSETNRTVSSGVVVEPTRSEKEEFGSRFSIGTGMRPSSGGGGGRVNFVETPSPRLPPTSAGDDIIPFPSTTLASSGNRAFSPARKPHKRANSELHIDQSLARSNSSFDSPPLAGLGIGLGSPPTRSRHESYSPEVDDAGDALRARRASRRLSGQAARTKLVLREKGKPTLTYQLGECIGKGQFGTVYRALNLNTGQVVAVKRIQLEGKTEAEIDELSNEVSLLQRLNHPAIVRYQGLLRSENYLNIILEYAESGSLQTTLRQFGQLPEGLVASYVVKILEGLAYLHEQGVVHCDLKAANILSTKTGNTKLSDFGVSLNLHAIKHTQGFGGAAKDVQGTPNWMAPEVIEMRGALPASDIWSLGCTICELIEGRPPYADLVAMSAMFRIVEDENGPPVPESSSDELRAFLAKCFKKDPRERPTAQELAEDPWLLQHFVPHQDLRPQDSLPFLRRISGDYQKARLSLDISRPVSPISTQLHDAPLSFESLVPLEAPRLPFAKDAGLKRDSLDSGYIASEETPNSPERATFLLATEETPETPHDWIRSSFSRAVECKLCGEHTKRHAVLCSRCGLVSHRRCTEFAPTCDLRGQLLGKTKYPLYPAATFSSTSAPPPASFSFSDYIPGFSKSRRPRPTPSSSDQSVEPVSPPSQCAGKAANVRRKLSNMLPSTKPRTPEHTPPHSLTRTYGGILGRNCSSTSVVTRRQENSSGSSIVIVSADDLMSAPISTEVSKGRLDKKKSHVRTQSQPVNKVKKPEGDCVVQ